MSDFVLPGSSSAWIALEKVGEGDAGEVYRVESLVEHRPAILKRPRANALSYEIRRQSDQIRREGLILQFLGDLWPQDNAGTVRTPTLLDQSKGGREFSGAHFIIIAEAEGVSLSDLARAVGRGLSPNELAARPNAQRMLLERIQESGVLPVAVIYACLHAILTVFETIHEAKGEAGEPFFGLLWNDVKIDHVFWNPENGRVTIIDWGNTILLEADGASRNRRHSRADDWRQFIEEMGRFLQQNAPDLAKTLEWPETSVQPDALTATIQRLKKRIVAGHQKNAGLLKELQETQAQLTQPGLDADQRLAELQPLQVRILDMGRLPDLEAALRLVTSAAESLASRQDWLALRELCGWAQKLPGANPAAWKLTGNLARHIGGLPNPGMFASIIQAALQADWAEALWRMLNGLGAEAEPEGWHELIRELRSQPDGKEEPPRPLLTLRRAALSVQSAAQALEDRLARNPDPETAAALEENQAYLERMRKVIYNWVQIEPLPPYSDLSYDEVRLILDEVERFTPYDLRSQMVRPQEQVHAVLDAWDHREFQAAGRGLRILLMVDPDRRRLLRAEKAIRAAPDWLMRLRVGPAQGEALREFVTNLEFEGRELHNQVGPAGWLDGLLDGLKLMRRGTWPGDLLLAQPALMADMPWLQRFERLERLQPLLGNGKKLVEIPALSGVHEGRVGPNADLAFLDPLDNWMPEARGSSARVYHAAYRLPIGSFSEAALKIMRTDKADYSLPLFREEVQILSDMRDVPGVNRMLECGFLGLDGNGSLPADHDREGIRATAGDALRLGCDAAGQFLRELEDRTRQGWTPYLLLEERRKENNLLLLCDAALNRGAFQPLGDLLHMAIQICDILQIAHQRKVVYRDHKILHYYWEAEKNGIFIIDWNVARYYPEGLTDMEIHMDLVQFAARGLHHILTGRTAPGALPLGPTRPDEIEAAAQTYKAQWTYDDRRLPPQVRAILESALGGAYLTASDLRQDLLDAYMTLE